MPARKLRIGVLIKGGEGESRELSSSSLLTRSCVLFHFLLWFLRLFGVVGDGLSSSSFRYRVLDYFDSISFV